MEAWSQIRKRGGGEVLVFNHRRGKIMNRFLIRPLEKKFTETLDKRFGI